ncbi:hypothetical protein ACQKC8_22590 [Stutzerimonas stutzeri]|uniref:hypothetical protein n=1 Tax=Stutzerimonas stutzeri TaxID=316 RepID=UPI003C2F7C6F
MSEFDPLAFFEKQFLHEIDMKERITVRAQIAFAVIFTIATISTYILRVLDYGSAPYAVGFIIPLMAAHFTCLAIAIVLALRAFWDNKFKYMPIASLIADYHAGLLRYNQEVAEYNKNQAVDTPLPSVDVGPSMSSYLSSKYVECASHNATINDIRSQNIHRSVGWILFSAAPLLIAAAFFVIYDMDVSSPRKETPITDQAVADQLYHINLYLRHERKSDD